MRWRGAETSPACKRPAAALEEAKRCLQRPNEQPVRDRIPKGILRDADGKAISRNAPIRKPTGGMTSARRVVKFHAKLGDLLAAVETFGLINAEVYRGRAASDIAHARSKAGDIEGALASALALDKPSVRTWALHSLAAGALVDLSERRDASRDPRSARTSNRVSPK